jgi:hypothetical protein
MNGGVDFYKTVVHQINNYVHIHKKIVYIHYKKKWCSNLIRISANSSGAHNTTEAERANGSTIVPDSLVHDIEHLIRKGP